MTRAGARPGWIYCIRVRRRGLLAWLPARGYIGKTRYADYETRIFQHFYGYTWDGVWHPPKWWAVDAVDYYPMYYSARVTDEKLTGHEIRRIHRYRPLHNHLDNLNNSRRVIPPPKELQRCPVEDEITAIERVGYDHRMPDRIRRNRIRRRGINYEQRIQVRSDGSVKVSGRAARTRIYK